MDQELKQVLLQAASEIRQLRRVNEVSQARVETLDLLASFLFARPRETQGIGMGEDIAWRIDQLIQARTTVPQKVSP